MILDFDKATQDARLTKDPTEYVDWPNEATLEAQAVAAVRQAQRALLEEVGDKWEWFGSDRDSFYDYLTAKRRELGV